MLTSLQLTYYLLMLGKAFKKIFHRSKAPNIEIRPEKHSDSKTSDQTNIKKNPPEKFSNLKTGNKPEITKDRPLAVKTADGTPGVQKEIDRLITSLLNEKCRQAPDIDYNSIIKNRASLSLLYFALKEKFFTLDPAQRQTIREKIKEWQLPGITPEINRTEYYKRFINQYQPDNQGSVIEEKNSSNNNNYMLARFRRDQEKHIKHESARQKRYHRIKKAQKKRHNWRG